MGEKKEMSPQDKLLNAIWGKPSPFMWKLFENALDLILELTEDDQSFMCEKLITDDGDTCEKECNNFSKHCLIRYLSKYKKGE